MGKSRRKHLRDIWEGAGVALLANRLDRVEQLLDDGMNVNLQMPEDGWTLLIKASCQCDGEVIRWLLAKGANPTLRDAKGDTALHWAAGVGNLGGIDALMNTKEDFKLARFLVRGFPGEVAAVEALWAAKQALRLGQVLAEVPTEAHQGRF